jgi:CBS domain-containing protein
MERPTGGRRVSFRRVSLERRADGRNAPVVFCPRRLSVTAVEECRGCERFLGLCVSSEDIDTHLRCAFADGEPVGTLARAGDSSAPAPGAYRAPVSEVMTAPVRSVQPSTQLRDVMAVLLSSSIGALPVLDEHGRPVGIVTKTDAMRRYHEDQDADREDATAADVMSRGVYVIPAGASISRAAALMAYEHVHHLLVVDPLGKPAGIVSTLDIARWVARADDYVVPRRERT